MSSCCAGTRRPEPQARGQGELAPLPVAVAVIGAGPVGLAAAARLLERGLEPVVLEAGPSAGTTPQGACCPPKPGLEPTAPCCGSATRKEPAQAEPAG